MILVSGREKEEVAPEVDQEDQGLEIDYEDPDQEKGSVRDLVKEEDQGLGKEEGQGQGTGEGLRDLDQEIGSKGQDRMFFFIIHLSSEVCHTPWRKNHYKRNAFCHTICMV